MVEQKAPYAEGIKVRILQIEGSRQDGKGHKSIRGQTGAAAHLSDVLIDLRWNNIPEESFVSFQDLLPPPNFQPEKV
ncbi:MAG: hypothetical protein MRK01_01135 [Candidatus Scalindua sp.]|nr:hypothetical protein [Candidatus Scalindua sp.]